MSITKYFIFDGNVAEWLRRGCKSLYPGSIPGVASKKSIEISFKKSKLCENIPR